MSDCSGPMAATRFHVGATCPFCQETIEELQPVVKCNRCGSVHHDLCWGHNQGCASYHCDQRTKRGEISSPELVISSAETDQVIVPPKPARKSAVEAARAFLPAPPRRHSIIAVIAVVLAGGSLLAAIYATQLALLSMAVAVAAMAVGVIAMVIVNTGRKVSGMACAATGTGIAAAVLIASIATLSVEQQRSAAHQQANFDIDESRPSEESLMLLSPPRARALRANVAVVGSSGGFLGSTRLGSGIVIRKEFQNAWILTNRHVLGAERARSASDVTDSIEVLFYNGENSHAEVVWLAPGEVDLAIVFCQVLAGDKIEPVDVSSAAHAQGTPVFAVGNPQGLNWSYTEGVISGIRTSQQEGRQVEIYQTQTPINQGNSGGGLYTQLGQLIGINTWTSDKSVAEGLSFAISTRTLLELLGEQGRKQYLQTVLPQGEPPATEERDQS